MDIYFLPTGMLRDSASPNGEHRTNLRWLQVNWGPIQSIHHLPRPLIGVQECIKYTVYSCIVLRLFFVVLLGSFWRKLKPMLPPTADFRSGFPLNRKGVLTGVGWRTPLLPRPKRARWWWCNAPLFPTRAEPRDSSWSSRASNLKSINITWT